MRASLVTVQREMLVGATSGLTVKITAPKKANDNMIVVTARREMSLQAGTMTPLHVCSKHLLEALNGAVDKHAKTGNKTER